MRSAGDHSLAPGWDGEVFYALARLGDTMWPRKDYARFVAVVMDGTESGKVKVYTHRFNLTDAFEAWKTKMEAEPSEFNMESRLFRAPSDRIEFRDGVFSYVLYETAGQIPLADFAEPYVVEVAP